MNFYFYIHKTTVLPFNGGHSVCHHPIVKGLSPAPATGTGTDKWQLFTTVVNTQPGPNVIKLFTDVIYKFL
jgi:hypothetical protein